MSAFLARKRPISSKKMAHDSQEFFNSKAPLLSPQGGKMKTQSKNLEGAQLTKLLTTPHYPQVAPLLGFCPPITFPSPDNGGTEGGVKTIEEPKGV